MRILLAVLSGLLVGSPSASGAAVNVTFEARPVGSAVGSGSSEVVYDDIAGGFILDVILTADATMKSAGVQIHGNAAFQHTGTHLYWGAYVTEYADGTGAGGVLVNQQGWAVSTTVCEQIAAGTLPLSGGVGKELGSIAADMGVGATNGFFAHLEFNAVPAKGEYWLTAEAPAGSPVQTYVGDMDGGDMDVTYTPLHILVPEPMTLALMSVAAAVMRRRRRR